MPSTYDNKEQSTARTPSISATMLGACVGPVGRIVCFRASMCIVFQQQCLGMCIVYFRAFSKNVWGMCGACVLYFPLLTSMNNNFVMTPTPTTHPLTTFPPLHPQPAPPLPPHTTCVYAYTRNSDIRSNAPTCCEPHINICEFTFRI